MSLKASGLKVSEDGAPFTPASVCAMLYWGVQLGIIRTHTISRTFPQPTLTSRCSPACRAHIAPTCVRFLLQAAGLSKEAPLYQIKLTSEVKMDKPTTESRADNNTYYKFNLR